MAHQRHERRQHEPTPHRPGLAQAMLARERDHFVRHNPRSRELAAKASRHLLFGVPLHWMNDLGMPFALQVEHAHGAQATDVDGPVLSDFCLGDTGAMFGHSPGPVAAALTRQATRGITTMLATAAMRAALSDVMTQAAYDHMLALAGSLADGLRSVIGRRQLPWCVTQVGARTEFQFFPQPPRNGSQAAGTLDAELGHLLHLGLLNCGVLITPFHNMMLTCPQTTNTDVQRLLHAFDQVLEQITPAS